MGKRETVLDSPKSPNNIFCEGNHNLEYGTAHNRYLTGNVGTVVVSWIVLGLSKLCTCLLNICLICSADSSSVYYQETFRNSRVNASLGKYKIPLLLGWLRKLGGIILSHQTQANSLHTKQFSCRN